MEDNSTICLFKGACLQNSMYTLILLSISVSFFQPMQSVIITVTSFASGELL